ncbi:MAG TPA: AtpZ/AtpI family protein [Sedimentibacter sp.]|nr:AtpZ/AtpI family protein [Sedimentibacter sp.]
MFLSRRILYLGDHHNNDKPSKKYSDMFAALAAFSQIGFTIAVSVLGGVLLGQYLDDKFGTDPWFLLAFSILGVGVGIRALFNIAKK